MVFPTYSIIQEPDVLLTYEASQIFSGPSRDGLAKRFFLHVNFVLNNHLISYDKTRDIS